METIDPVQFRPKKMYLQLYSLCEAVRILLESQFTDAAATVLRTAMWDTHRLLYLNQNPELRGSLILSLEIEFQSDRRRLLQVAKRLGKDVTGMQEKIDERDRAIEESRIARGIDKIRRFPRDGDSIARAVGREADILGHKMFSISAHGGSKSPLMDMTRSDKGDIGLYAKSSNQNVICGLALLASDFLFVATIAVAEMWGWPNLDELQREHRKIAAQFEKIITVRERADLQ